MEAIASRLEAIATRNKKLLVTSKHGANRVLGPAVFSIFANRPWSLWSAQSGRPNVFVDQASGIRIWFCSITMKKTKNMQKSRGQGHHAGQCRITYATCSSRLIQSVQRLQAFSFMAILIGIIYNKQQVEDVTERSVLFNAFHSCVIATGDVFLIDSSRLSLWPPTTACSCLLYIVRRCILLLSDLGLDWC